MADNDGSKPLDQSEPVIMTFAMSLEEWAMVSASLKMMVELSEEIDQKRGHSRPEKVAQTMAASSQFARMIFDEVRRLNK